MKVFRLFICICFCSLFSACIFSCNKTANNDIPQPSHTPQAFKITGIEYNLQANINGDSSFHRTDTSTYFNPTNQKKTDFKVDPYNALENNITIELEAFPEKFPKDIRIDSGYFLPAIIQNGDVFYATSDSLYLDHLSDTIQMSFKPRSTTSVTITPTPQTWYQIWGEYYRVRYSLPVKIKLSNIKDNSLWELKALLKGSFITSHSATTQLHVEAHDIK